MFSESYCYDTLVKKTDDLYQLVYQIRDTVKTVLIQGKSGSGKEAVCHLLNQSEQYKNKPVIAINCAAIPADLMESELFGFEKGSFTGADVSQMGKFEAAADGTLILDEISEMPLALQAKILRVLEAREFYRVGGQTPVRVNARIIALTNKKLSDCVNSGIFREDLYYRLDVLRLDVPALEERNRDIPLLIDHIINDLAKSHSKEFAISPEVYHFLCQRKWEGNIRELKNFVTRLFYLANTPVVTINDLSNNNFGMETSHKQYTVNTMPLQNLSLEEMEKKYILETLTASKGNKSKAARMLQISLKTLRNKLKIYAHDITVSI